MEKFLNIEEASRLTPYTLSYFKRLCSNQNKSDYKGCKYYKNPSGKLFLKEDIVEWMDKNNIVNCENSEE